ncbi:HTH-type transcriptional activator IlvY [Alteromonas facilis]|uniref:HTH-type transcriptional activator IlvY n=1 Tax=Alteromonas facilis TaxID=2048004 RepID=UPI000C28F058|nr:HTH-type transcriptional activator IlvY [Alteromonas facilis]
MELRDLQLFCHLAGSLNFSQTASAMFVSPSTLSRVIQRIEQECGAVLFERNNRRVVLTHAGQQVLEFAEPMLSQWRQLKQTLNNDGEQLKGHLRFYCSVTASQSHLPRLLDKFRQQHPLVDFKLETGDPGIAVQRVLDDKCDIAIAINAPDLPAELYFKALAKVPLVLALPKRMGISHISQIDWRKTPVVMPESGPTRRTVHHWFAEAGIRPHVYASVGGNEAIVSMVALDCGVGFVPRVVLENSALQSQVDSVEVDNIEPYELGLCCQQGRKAERLIEAMFAQL